jgi:hypothetical protein
MSTQMLISVNSGSKTTNSIFVCVLYNSIVTIFVLGFLDSEIKVLNKYRQMCRKFLKYSYIRNGFL